MPTTNFDRMTRTPWWAKVLGWWARWRRDRADRLLAAMRRSQHERGLHEPRFMISIVGTSHYINKPEQIFSTHRWDLYETPAGERSLKFIPLHSSADVADGADHRTHSHFLTPWLNGVYTMDYEKTARAQRRGEKNIFHGSWSRTNAN